MTTTAPQAQALSEELIAACLDLVRDAKPVSRKPLMERFGVGAGTVQAARRIALERLGDEQAKPARHRRSPYSPPIDGRKLAERRFINGRMSQSDLARAVGCSKVWIVKIEAEKGRPAVELFSRLCKVLHCKGEDLIHDE